MQYDMYDQQYECYNACPEVNFRPQSSAARQYPLCSFANPLLVSRSAERSYNFYHHTANACEHHCKKHRKVYENVYFKIVLHNFLSFV